MNLCREKKTPRKGDNKNFNAFVLSISFTYAIKGYQTYYISKKIINNLKGLKNYVSYFVLEICSFIIEPNLLGKSGISKILIVGNLDLRRINAKLGVK